MGLQPALRFQTSIPTTNLNKNTTIESASTNSSTKTSETNTPTTTQPTSTQAKPRLKRLLAGIATIASSAGNTIATKIQPKMNQLAKSTGSVVNFLKDAAVTGVGLSTTAAAGAFINTTALGIATIKAGIDLNTANTTVNNNKTELANLEDKLSKATNDEDKEKIKSEIKDQKKKLNKSKNKRGTKTVDLATKSSLFTGSIAGTIGGIATIAAQLGATAAPAIGAVATGAVFSAIAPAGLLIGGIAMVGVNAYKGIKNVGKLNTAKKDVENLKKELKTSTPEQKKEIRQKLLDAENKVDKYQTKWNSNKKSMLIGGGLTVAGGAMAAAAITGVGAPIAIAIGLGIAAVGMGSSGKTPKFLQNPIKTIKQAVGLEKKDPPSFEQRLKSCETKCNKSNDPQSLQQKTEIETLKTNLPTMTKDEASEQLNQIMSGSTSTFVGDTPLMLATT